MNIVVSIACLSFAGISAMLWKFRQHARREAYIRDFMLPKGLYDKLREHHPHLTLKDCQLVAQGLRQFFLAHLKSGKQYVSMPSQVADDLWHEFILYTKNYQYFCRHAFGSFLHHTPAVVLGKGQSNAGIRRTWRYACQEENINPHKPTRLPLLFALDSKFNIPSGFVYVPDCDGVKRQGDDASGAAGAYCGADLGSFGSDGDSSDGDGGSDGGDGDGGGDGCGGGGCGGGGD